ncbi:amidohydrolase family protein [Pelagicoccus sp. SDUM812002]|uniref:amidohydrolase family protein n=1 Tax=Pelagicoccus sp. SDUM812002 TaxID=3041266 RepID=UPI00281050A8|nr:amidohydrolase family protein [Pelagicoccus sp. SDUM812002]MDQ8187764.1 amidohydrolase family protein [Pelagicoccus sp. SDUM812002]
MSGSSIFITDIDFLVTADADQNVLAGAWILAIDGFIDSFGVGTPPEVEGRVRTLRGRGRILTPGFVNTHHHLYQNMARAYTPGNNLPLLPWLAHMNKLWRYFREEDLHTCTRLGLAELMMSGATTVADHHYVFPEGATDMTVAQFDAAEIMGARFHASRGSMNVKSDLISDWALQDEETILTETEQLIEKYHDSTSGSYRQIIVAPCAATSCSASLLERSAALAKKHHVGLHTHCGETVAENDFSVEKLGLRPLDFLLERGWDYNRAWLAHGIHFNDEELSQLSQYGIGVAHCPNANMRLGSGICRVPELIKQGIKVGVGVDGSASNDSGHMLAELRQAMYLARVRYGAEAMSALDTIDLGTWRAAALIGREDVGKIETGLCADFALFPSEELYSNGAENVVDALLICHARQVSELIVGGSVRIENGQFVEIDLIELQTEHKERAAKVRSRSFNRE